MIKKNFIFFKTHSANVSLNNHQYTNNKNSFGLIYIVRDPRDIVISYSKYQNISIDRAIDKITNKAVIEYSGFKNNDKFHIFNNENDFLNEASSIEWVKATFGDRAKVFENGGHLGDLITDEVRSEIIEVLED